LKYAIIGKYHGQITDVNDSNAEERIAIAKTYTNPLFTLRDRAQDQMLIELTTPATTNSVVKVNLDNTGLALREGNDLVTVIGLGQTYSSTDPTVEPPDILQQVTMQIVPNSECQDMYDEYAYFVPTITEDMIW
jgi:secreted trypsin-like serine protease